MITDDLKRYVQESLGAGQTKEEIARSLIAAGWPVSDIEETLRILQADVVPEVAAKKTESTINRKTETNKVAWLSYAVLVGVIVILGGTIFAFWQDKIDLAQTNTQKVRDFYTRIAESQISFTDAGEMVLPDEQKFLSQKAEYNSRKESFVEVNLRTMRLALYENGTKIKEVEILTKGREGGWWETPSGNYKILGKEINHFSSIGKVWMPYSMQFYGNYFIHGWPHYDDGTPVAQGYSGGCVRLSNEDAKEVFDFAKKGMPILVLEDKEARHFGLLKPKAGNAVLPALSAKAFLISDLASGETILEKNANAKLPIASLTKLATAVVAHELVYLGRPIKVTPQTLASAYQIFQVSVGEYYYGFDLLYPLLMQSSNDAAKTLASFLGEKNFVQNMNTKASSLEMADTSFDDSSGMSATNISTASDVSKLLQYIYYKRRFLFDISKGKEFENIGLVRIGDTVNIRDLKNFNEFSDQPDLIGMKNGETSAAGQTIATAWNIRTPQGDVPIGIIVLDSKDRVRDTKNLLKWVRDNFEVL